jgi:hypothetical protein
LMDFPSRTLFEYSSPFRPEAKFGVAFPANSFDH